MWLMVFNQVTISYGLSQDGVCVKKQKQMLITQMYVYVYRGAFREISLFETNGEIYTLLILHIFIFCWF